MNTRVARLQQWLGEDRPQSVGEEAANSISHGVGFLLAVAALPMLLGTCVDQGGRPLDLLAATVFAATMMLLYLVSAVYHALPSGHLKALFNRIDHAAIYLFIAGSYTPFALGGMREDNGWLLCGLVWLLAMMGAGAKLLNKLSHPLLSTGLYIAMGWVTVFAAGPLLDRISATCLHAGGHRVPARLTAALRALRLALAGDGRQRLPLLRGLVVREVTGPSAPLDDYRRQLQHAAQLLDRALCLCTAAIGPGLQAVLALVVEDRQQRPQRLQFALHLLLQLHRG
jgi:hemolysin III